MVTNPKNIDEIRLMMIISKLHQEGLLQKDISNKLAINASTVSRLLKRARDYIKIEYEFPGYEKLEADLIYKYNLADAIVVETGEEKHSLEILGQAAARYFINKVEPNSHVALSCGETLLEMLKTLPTRRNLVLTISQLSIESDPETIHQSPSTLVGILKAKSSTKSYVYGLQLPPIGLAKDQDLKFRHALHKSDCIRMLHDEALKSDVVFVGIGTPSFYRKEHQSFLKMATRAVPNFEQRAKKLGIIGELNNQIFDERGQNRTEEVTNLRDEIINLLSLDEIKEMAADHSKCKVVLVATGSQKTTAIKTALQHHMVNVIITTKSDAERLTD